MENTDYANTDSGLVPTHGGCLAVSVTAGTNAQANAGTSIPCKVCYISQGLAVNSVVRFGIETNTSVAISTTVSLGATIPSNSLVGRRGPIEVPIDDVAKLWFSSAATACVGITYRG